MPDSTQQDANETHDPRCRWCGAALSSSSSTAEDWQLNFCSCLCRDNYWRTQEAEEEEAAERAAGPLFRAERTEESQEEGPALDDWVVLRRDPTRIPRCRRCARPPITTSITAEHWQRLFCSERCRQDYTRDAAEQIASRSRTAAEGAQPVWLTEGAEGAEPIPNDQLPRGTPEWLRRILNWRPVERTQPTPTAPEDEQRDRTPSDSTTCPDSDTTEDDDSPR